MKTKILITLIIFINLLAFAQQINAERICDSSIYIRKDSVDIDINDYITNKKLDPFLIKAIIRAESAKPGEKPDPKAISPKGAVGLMQLMPDTFYEIAQEVDKKVKIYNPELEDGEKALDNKFKIREGKEKEYSEKLESLLKYKWDPEKEDSRFDPEISIELGVKYFEKMWNIFKDEENKLELALAAYNAGYLVPINARRQQQLNELFSKEISLRGAYEKKWNKDWQTLVTDGYPPKYVKDKITGEKVRGETSKSVEVFQEWYKTHKGEIKKIGGKLGSETRAKIDEVWQQMYPKKKNPKGIIPRHKDIEKYIENVFRYKEEYKKECEKCNASSSITLKKAIKKDYVTAILSGTGTYTGRSILLDVNNKTDEYLKIQVPLGLILYSDNLEDQNMVISKEEIICLTPGDPEVYLYALCVNSDRGVPSNYTKFSLGPITDKKLLEVLKKNDEEGLYRGSGQSRVWSVTGDMDIDSLSNKVQRTLKTIKIKILTILGIIVKIIKIVIVASIFILIFCYLYEKFILKKKKEETLPYKLIRIINNTRKKLSKILSKKIEEKISKLLFRKK